MLDFDALFEYKTKNNDDSEDKWRIYLFDFLTGNLKERLDEMIETSENKNFYLGLKHEYGYFATKSLKEAISFYKQGGRANSTDYLSMARLYDIYKIKDKRFNIVLNKDLELIYLFKTFAYLPIYFFNSDIKKNRFPLNIYYAVASFLKNNDPEVKLILSYFDDLIKSGKYNDILSTHDCNLIKGFLEGYFNYITSENENYLNLLVALSLDGNPEANCRLISIYLTMLNKTDEKEEKKIGIIKSKIYDQFLKLKEEKYYKSYAQYGLFLYNEMRMFDEALNIFKQGYENNNYECAIYYFHAFTKSNNQSIYDKDKFNSQNFINIFQTLIDAFIYGNHFSIELMFDYYYIIGKKYNLFPQLSSKYMKYLDEIALLCVSFSDKGQGKILLKKYNPYLIDYIYHSANHSLSRIYMYGLTNKVKKNLLKAEICAKAAMEINEYTQPYYTYSIYKIRKKLFKLRVFEDINDLNQIGNELFKLYEKYKDYKYYGNSFYYIFGKLYEKGIGTNKNDKKAYHYYQRGCHSLVNLNDSFIIVYKRYLSLKIVQSDKFLSLFCKVNNNIPSFLVKFRLSIGNDISLSIRKDMTIEHIKNELYKKVELQNLKIKVLLYGGEMLLDNSKISENIINNNGIIVVIVEQKKQGTV